MKDIYGNTMTTLTVPQTGNIDDNSSINIDAAAPSNVITGASYNPSTGVITLMARTSPRLRQRVLRISPAIWTGRRSGGTLMVILTAQQMVAIGGDDFAFTTGVGGNVANTTIVSPTQMTITLTELGKDDLHGTAGFGADGVVKI